MRSATEPVIEHVKQTVARLSAEIAKSSAHLGTRVNVRSDVCTERAKLLSLPQPGAVSANRCCRLIQTRGGWIAVNLPRETDILSVPAWIGCALDADPWTVIVDEARSRFAGDLTASAQILGLAVAEVSSVRANDYMPVSLRMGEPCNERRRASRRLRVLDISDLWAGPLCGALFAAADCDVIKINTVRSIRSASPAFEQRLNGLKTKLALDLRNPLDIRTLRNELRTCDIAITSARPRAFEQLGLLPSAVFEENPGLVWVAITGYGWTAPNAMRVGFGDDAAAAGGLLNWAADGHPAFVGDAVADPLTGLVAALAAFKAVADGGGVLIDAALAHTAAGVAHSAVCTSMATL